jgi:hypothetical protein
MPQPVTETHLLILIFLEKCFFRLPIWSIQHLKYPYIFAAQHGGAPMQWAAAGVELWI